MRNVCFSAFHAYPLFDPRVDARVGGMETRAWQLATGLAMQPDWNVHFVVQAPRRFSRRQFGGLTVWNRGDGFDAIRNEVSRRVRFNRQFWPTIEKWDANLIWQLPVLAAMRPFRNPPPPASEPDPFYSKIQPDVFCCFGVSGQSASVVATGRALAKPSVLFLASNADLDERFSPESTFMSPYGECGADCWTAIQNATLIVTQNAEQQRLLSRRFDREGMILPSPIDLAAWDRAAITKSPLLDRLGLSRFVLWVGRADSFHKRPMLCLELARMLSDVAFLMILNPSDAAIERQVRQAAPPNVTVVESVPFSGMPALLRQAELLVSTGSAAYEGTPNVFLQAAASQIPVASLEVPLPVCPDSGFEAKGDLDRLAGFIRDCWRQRQDDRQQGRLARREVERQNDLPVVAGQLADMLREMTPIQAD